MSVFAADPGNLPVQGGLLGLILTFGGVFLRTYLKNESGRNDLADERKGEAADVRSQMHLADLAHQTEIASLRAALAAKDADYWDQRTAKHHVINQLSAAQLTLDTVRRLSELCTCGALEPVLKFLDRREAP